MRCVIDKKELLTALQRVQGVAEKRNTLPILSYILLEARKEGIQVLATDMEVGIQGFYPARVQEEGLVALSARKLHEIVRELTGEEVQISSDDHQWVTLISGKSHFRITGPPADDYPAFPPLPKESFFKIDHHLFADLIRRTLFAAGENDARYILNGILLSLQEKEEKQWLFRLVGTDGHRLAVAEDLVEIDPRPTSETELSVILPKKGVHEIRKLLEEERQTSETRLAISQGQLILERGNTLLVARLMEGSYPNYEQVIPKENFQKASVKKEIFQGALKRVSILSREKTHAVRLTLGKGRLLLSSNNPDMGEAFEEMEAKFPGEEMITGFNARYLLDALEGHCGEEVVLELKDPLSPCLIREKERNFQCVVMPMRV